MGCGYGKEEEKRYYYHFDYEKDGLFGGGKWTERVEFERIQMNWINKKNENYIDWIEIS